MGDEFRFFEWIPETELKDGQENSSSSSSSEGGGLHNQAHRRAEATPRSKEHQTTVPPERVRTCEDHASSPMSPTLQALFRMRDSWRTSASGTTRSGSGRASTCGAAPGGGYSYYEDDVYEEEEEAVGEYASSSESESEQELYPQPVRKRRREATTCKTTTACLPRDCAGGRGRRNSCVPTTGDNESSTFSCAGRDRGGAAAATRAMEQFEDMLDEISDMKSCGSGPGDFCVKIPRSGVHNNRTLLTPASTTSSSSSPTTKAVGLGAGGTTRSSFIIRAEEQRRAIEASITAKLNELSSRWSASTNTKNASSSSSSSTGKNISDQDNHNDYRNNLSSASLVTREQVSQVCGYLLSVLPLGATTTLAAATGTSSCMAGGMTAAGAALGAAAPVVAMAFCPNPLMTEGAVLDLVEGIQEYMPENWSMPAQQNGMLVVTFCQGSLALGRMFLGDVFGGAYALMLATLGYNSRHPGPAANWLKTYILITFINGTVGTVDFIQNMLLGNYPLLAKSLPLAVNVAHLVQISVPLISFAGAYIGWQYIKAQKAYMARYHYEQAKPPIPHPSLPWPPPALPPPSVLEHMNREMEAFQKQLTAMTNEYGELVLDLEKNGVPVDLDAIDEDAEEEEDDELAENPAKKMDKTKAAGAPSGEAESSRSVGRNKTGETASAPSDAAAVPSNSSKQPGRTAPAEVTRPRTTPAASASSSSATTTSTSSDVAISGAAPRGPTGPRQASPVPPPAKSVQHAAFQQQLQMKMNGSCAPAPPAPSGAAGAPSGAAGGGSTFDATNRISTVINKEAAVVTSCSREREIPTPTRNLKMNAIHTLEKALVENENRIAGSSPAPRGATTKKAISAAASPLRERKRPRQPTQSYNAK
mmetsp:Transcript_1123/g.2414  ORF Transcript_1123/g.2414 Transcript_1123/m.2414 type:complete len:874 (+) Transcript_1123:349-2970(+)